MRITLFVCFFLFALPLFGQHDHPIDTTAKNPAMKSHEGHDDHAHTMTSAFSVLLPMSRDGSGTAWQPDSTPPGMYMHHWKNGKTMLMAHGLIFLRYTHQDFTTSSLRGDEQADAPNMFMVQLTHKERNNIFGLHTMISFDPLTVGESGYPLLMQTGETYKGQPLVDRQHPHDMFASLAASFAHSFSWDGDVSLYFGYPGEPALGPVMFWHRASGMDNPDAPLGHHWQDATHIVFGVGTAGFRYKKLKLEGSVFTGREPDENRYDFDKATFDSYSYRVQIQPSGNVVLQVSQGMIKSPEVLEPESDVTRTTASAHHIRKYGHRKFLASSLVWGMNDATHGNRLHSILAESRMVRPFISYYLRYEFVQKDAHELNLDTEFFDEHQVFGLQAITLGLNRLLFSKLNTDFSAGIQSTLSIPAGDLETVYGKLPLSAEVYLKIAPALTQ